MDPRQLSTDNIPLSTPEGEDQESSSVVLPTIERSSQLPDDTQESTMSQYRTVGEMTAEPDNLARTVYNSQFSSSTQDQQQQQRQQWQQWEQQRSQSSELSDLGLTPEAPESLKLDMKNKGVPVDEANEGANSGKALVGNQSTAELPQPPPKKRRRRLSPNPDENINVAVPTWARPPWTGLEANEISQQINTQVRDLASVRPSTSRRISIRNKRVLEEVPNQDSTGGKRLLRKKKAKGKRTRSVSSVDSAPTSSSSQGSWQIPDFPQGRLMVTFVIDREKLARLEYERERNAQQAANTSLAENNRTQLADTAMLDDYEEQPGERPLPENDEGQLLELPTVYETNKDEGKNKKTTLPPLSGISPVDEDSLLEDIPNDIIDLARSMMERQPIGSKAEPHGHPAVWAESRQALNQTLPYFRSPQGGSYTSDKVYYGFLLDHVADDGQFMSTDVIITRAGGGMEKDQQQKTKSWIQGKDQVMADDSPFAMIRNVQNQNALAVIVGQGNDAMHVEVPKTYCVLDFYKPVLVWSEKALGKKDKPFRRVRFRFERLRGNGETPWHAPKVNPNSPSNDIAGPLFRDRCLCCDHEYPQVYLVGWMCLNEACDKFWKINGELEAPFDHTLLYNPAFLLDRTPWALEAQPWELKPPLPDLENIMSGPFLATSTRGICCPRCGRCTPRYKLLKWVCNNEACDFKGLEPKWSILKPQQEFDVTNAIGQRGDHTHNYHLTDRGVTLKVSAKGDRKISEYSFEGIDGRLLHVTSSGRINAETQGPDSMFQELQEAAFDENNPFKPEKAIFRKSKSRAKKGRPSVARRRNSKRTSTQEPELEDATEYPFNNTDDEEEGGFETMEDGNYMNSFSINYGWPYNFGTYLNSQPFEAGPSAVRRARSMLQWGADEFLGSTNDTIHKFNEQLLLVYLENQGMNYHDDGESGLGPRIGTLTLGGTAKMKFRLKDKYFKCIQNENAGSDFFLGKPLSKLLYQYDSQPEKRKRRYDQWVRLYQEFVLMKATGDKNLERRLQEMKAEVLNARKTLGREGAKHAQDCVTLTLKHGDMVFMEGYDLQKYFQHQITSNNVLRFALTCRTVLPEHLPKEKHPKYEVRDDECGYKDPVFDD